MDYEYMPGQINLNQSLMIFFTDALRVAIKNPSQVLTFLRTLFWLRKAARLRARWKKRGIQVPPILMLSITNDCNLRCPGCYNQSFHSSGPKELRDEKLWQITEEARELGISFFVIAGGEPLMRPAIMNIMRAFPEIIFLLFTNGTLIDARVIAYLSIQHNVIPLISLEGKREETDARRGEGVYDQLMQTMERLRKQNTFYGISLTLTRMNFSMITSDAFIDECHRNGCKFFLFLEYTPTQEGTEDWVLTTDQRDRMRTMMKNYRNRFKALFIAVPWDEDDVGGCLSAGRGFVHINAVGDLEPCPFAPFSDTNVREQSLQAALQSELCEKIRNIPELSIEKGGGCVLWKERERVKSLLEKTGKQ